MKTHELLERTGYQLDFGITLTDESREIAKDIGHQIATEFGGELQNSSTGFGIRDISLLFQTMEQADQAAKTIRRRARGKPRFEVAYVDIIPVSF